MAFLISRKPISDYAQNSGEYTDRVLSSEEEFQLMVFEAVGKKRNGAVTDSINGRYYQYYDDDDGDHAVWTVLMSETDTYWVSFYVTGDKKDQYHDLMVQLIDMVEIDHSYRRG